MTPARHPCCRITLLALLPALACSQSPPAQPVAGREEVRSTRAADLRDTKALLLLMADQKRFEATVFVALLDSSAGVRTDLAVALGRLGDPRGRGLLQGLLIDVEPEVRRAAAFALGELEFPADVAAADSANSPSSASSAISALLRASVDDDAETGALAVEALGKLQAPLADVRRTLTALAPDAAARRLAPVLFRFREDAMVEVAVELARGALSPVPSTPLEPAAPAEPEAARTVHFGAAYALSRDAHAGALPHLRRLLEDPEPQIRAWAARGLGDVGELADFALLEALLLDPAPSPRIQAIRAGARIAARVQAVPPLGWGRLLGRLIDDPLPGVRAIALESSAPWIPQPEVRQAVLRRLASGEPRERELALVALAQAADSQAEDAVRRAAAATARRLRASAAEAAGLLGLEELLEKLVLDAEPVVRVAAVGALLQLADEAGAGASQSLRAAVARIASRSLGDPDPSVRATALEALVEAPVLPVGTLQQALAAAERDPLSDARLAGVRALAARAGEVAAEHEAAVSTLESLTENSDYLVRREAASALAGMGLSPPAVGPVATARTGPVYAQILSQTDRERIVEVVTTRGSFRIRLACPQAPLTCLSFLQLAGQGFFDGLTFHRVVPDFVVQTGDPRGDGWGGPGFALRDEINRQRFGRGAVGMALSGPDTGGSQFFIALSPQPHLDGGYTVFGQVAGDDSVLDQLRQEDGLVTIREVETGE